MRTILSLSRFHWVLLCITLGSHPLQSAAELTPPQDADPHESARLIHAQRARQQYAQHKERYADDTAVWVAPGVIARREPPQVEIWAEATGLTENEPVEFILIAPKSGHDYEAIAVAHALPSDIHEALEFIGLPAGAPFNPVARRGPDSRRPRGRGLATGGFCICGFPNGHYGRRPAVCRRPFRTHVDYLDL